MAHLDNLADRRIQRAADKAAILVALTFVLGAAAFWVGQSYFEAQSFNRLTGNNVSTWDAMFVSLRVQESAD